VLAAGPPRTRAAGLWLPFICTAHLPHAQTLSQHTHRSVRLAPTRLGRSRPPLGTALRTGHQPRRTPCGGDPPRLLLAPKSCHSISTRHHLVYPHPAKPPGVPCTAMVAARSPCMHVDLVVMCVQLHEPTQRLPIKGWPGLCLFCKACATLQNRVQHGAVIDGGTSSSPTLPISLAIGLFGLCDLFSCQLHPRHAAASEMVAVTSVANQSVAFKAQHGAHRPRSSRCQRLQLVCAASGEHSADAARRSVLLGLAGAAVAAPLLAAAPASAGTKLLPASSLSSLQRRGIVTELQVCIRAVIAARCGLQSQTFPRPLAAYSSRTRSCMVL
jgi:hypothetical protein